MPSVRPHLQTGPLMCWCGMQNIHVTAYSPLGTPDSESEVKREETPSLIKEPAVKAAAEKLGKNPVQILIRWGLQHGTSVIPKATSEDHLKVRMPACCTAPTGLQTFCKGCSAVHAHRRRFALRNTTYCILEERCSFVNMCLRTSPTASQHTTAIDTHACPLGCDSAMSLPKLAWRFFVHKAMRSPCGQLTAGGRLTEWLRDGPALCRWPSTALRAFPKQWSCPQMVLRSTYDGIQFARGYHLSPDCDLAVRGCKVCTPARRATSRCWTGSCLRRTTRPSAT